MKDPVKILPYIHEDSPIKREAWDTCNVRLAALMPQTDMDHLIRYYSSLDLFLNATRYRSLVEGETTASIPEARIVIEDAEAAQKAISNYKSASNRYCSALIVEFPLANRSCCGLGFGEGD